MSDYLPRRAPRFFGRRRWLLEQENRELRLAIGEVMAFVTSELDPDPHPWEAYATSPDATRRLRIEQSVALLDNGRCAQESQP